LILPYFNINLFIVLITVIYLYMILFTLINLSQAVRVFYNKLLDKLNALINKNKKVGGVLDFIKSKILFYMNKALRIVFKFLLILSYYIFKFDLYIIKNDSVLVDEPVNYTALVLRKLYTENIRTVIVYSSLVLVIFYFILSVF